MAISEILEAREAWLALEVDSLDRPVRGQERWEPQPLLETIGSVDDDYEPADQRFTLEAACRKLPVRERLVLHMRFIEDRAQSEIAATTNPRFTEGNFEKNLRIVDEVQAVASELDATPAQVALAWLLAQGDDIAPIPGTKRVFRVEENTAADAIELSAEQIQRLNDIDPATGARHDEANMAAIDH